VHFKLLDQPSVDYETVKSAEKEQLRRERVRLWYVAVTRACDLLLLPRQSERKPDDWMSIVDLKLGELPIFDHRAIDYAPNIPKSDEPQNAQDETTWPAAAPPPARDEIFADATVLSDQLPPTSENAGVAGAIRDSRERASSCISCSKRY
jgi:ATP-dependent exoDNAse (exonuclease V) beta subunit